MVSVTSTQSRLTAELPKNTSQAIIEQLAAEMDASKEKMEATVAALKREHAAGASASARIRPATISDADSRAKAQLASFRLENPGELIWTRANGFTAKFASRNPEAAGAYTPSTPTPHFGVKDTDNAGKGGELIVSNSGGKLNGGAGNDTIVAGAGSVIHAGEGNDYIRSAGQLYGDKGNDRIEGWGNLYGGKGDDTITLTHRASAAYGGAGNDKIIVRAGSVFTGYGDATAEGGKGNDFIQISGDAPSRAAGETTTVRFNVGDGKDHIEANRADVVLELGEGFTADNMKISYSEYGETAIITFDGNEDDQITIANVDSVRDEAASTFTIKFADGSTYELEELTSWRDAIYDKHWAFFDR